MSIFVDLKIQEGEEALQHDWDAEGRGAEEKGRNWGGQGGKAKTRAKGKLE